MVCCLLGLALAGCGSSSGATTSGSLPPTIVAPPAAANAARVDGSWSGTLPNGDRLTFELAARSSSFVSGDGVLFRDGDPRVLKVEGSLQDANLALLRLVSLDEGTPGEVTDLTMNLQPNGSAVAELQDLQTFPLTRQDAQTRQKLWNGNGEGGLETYRIDAKNDFGEEFHVRLTVDVRDYRVVNTTPSNGSWTYIGGRPLWAFIEGQAYGRFWNDRNEPWVQVFFRDDAGLGTYGQVLFRRHDDGQPGSKRELSRSDSILNTRESYGYVTGTATLEIP